MTLTHLIGVACAAAMLSTGAASAAPISPLPLSAGAPVEAVALVAKGTPAGRAKQRHRTRLDRCRNVPSRC